MDPKDAGTALLVMYLQPVLLTPLFGILVDMKGQRLLCTLLALCFEVLAHYILAEAEPNDGDDDLDEKTPLVAPGILGLFYSMFRVVLMSQIPMVVKNKKVLGTAFGVQAAVQNSGQTVIPILVGVI